jgi:hypothetical protein
VAKGATPFGRTDCNYRSVFRKVFENFDLQIPEKDREDETRWSLMRAWKFYDLPRILERKFRRWLERILRRKGNSRRSS